MSKKLNIDPINNWINKDTDPLIISGPCSAETYDQLFETCKQLKSHGITLKSRCLETQNKTRNF